MIKSLLDADENPPPETKVVVEETTIEQPQPFSAANAVADENVFTADQLKEVEDLLEIPPPNRAGSDDAQIYGVAQDTAAKIPQPIGSANSQIGGETFSAQQQQSNVFSGEATAQTKDDAPIFQAAFEPETQAETMRKSGLAYAAAITLFGAVVFMMILGWGFDLLFGSSPLGVVGGIVLGALIGFVQFFRLSSQIFK